MKIIDNIKKCFLKIGNNKLYDELKDKDNIIKEQENTIYDFKNRINKNISDQLNILRNIEKGIRICELNGNKPEVTYRNLQLAKLKIKSSIADSKQLLNKYNFDFIPESDFNIIKLNNQVGG